MIVSRKRSGKKSANPEAGLQKTPTGIKGVDDLLGGGLPKGRPTLICGSAGCGKTLFAMEFLVRGATEFNEPGVFMAFEETEEELANNVVSLGFDLKQLVAQKKVALDYVRIERSEIAETGEYDLEGLFIRLGDAIKSIGAKRVVLDTVEALFAGLPNEAILRAELRRLFMWLKEKGVTAIITGERGEGTLTRYGLEEYVADCVILLDHRVIRQISTRRLRVVKYRGSVHGTNEYPFLIGTDGISVIPITSLGLSHEASAQRISSGIPQLDEMLGGKGYFCGSSILISGTAGSGKSSLAASFAQAACERGERCLYFAFEESPQQILRNMSSIGLHLAPCVRKGFLRFRALRPTVYGLEMHLLTVHESIRKLKPQVVIFDPLSNLISIGDSVEVKAMLTRLIDFLKIAQITTLFTNLTLAEGAAEQTDIGISSLMDTWILLRNLEHSGERNRGLYVLKSRGMAHSNQIREFQLSNKGIDLIAVCVREGIVLTGAARMAEEARVRTEVQSQRQHIRQIERLIRSKQKSTQSQIEALRAALVDDVDKLKQELDLEACRASDSVRERSEIARVRMTGKNGEPAIRSARDKIQIQ